MQHLEGIARAVPDCQHHVVRAHGLATGEGDAAYLAVLDLQVVHPTAEADFAAEVLDGCAHVLDHRHQAEGADVWLADGEDLLGRAGLHEFGQHLASVVLRILDLAVQLAVRKRAGAAFAELHVRLRVEHALAPQAEGVHRAFAHRLAAFEDDRAEAHLRQQQAGEQAAGAGTDDDRAQGRARWRRRDKVIAGIGARTNPQVTPGALHHRIRVQDIEVQGVDQQDGAALARVVAALVNGQAAQFVITKAQARQDRRPKCFGRMVQR